MSVLLNELVYEVFRDHTSGSACFFHYLESPIDCTVLDTHYTVDFENPWCCVLRCDQTDNGRAVLQYKSGVKSDTV